MAASQGRKRDHGQVHAIGPRHSSLKQNRHSTYSSIDTSPPTADEPVPFGRKRKRRKADTAEAASRKSHPRPKKIAVNPIKNRIRDLRRQLQNVDIAANVRVGHERELANMEQELMKAEIEKEKNEMIKKYHMVRFFGEAPASTGSDGMLQQQRSRVIDCLRSKLTVYQKGRRPHAVSRRRRKLSRGAMIQL